MDYIIFNVSKVDLLSAFHRQAVTKVQSNRTKNRQHKRFNVNNTSNKKYSYMWSTGGTLCKASMQET